MAREYYDRSINAWICRACNKNADDCQCDQEPEPDAVVTAVKWVPTTEKRYNDMMGCVPPAAYGSGGGFQVGEPYDHKIVMEGGRAVGKPTFRSFKMDGETYLEATEPLTFAEFKAEVGSATYYYRS